MKDIARRAPELATGALAALALAMAREIDDEDNSATSKSLCAGRLHAALDRLRELVPPEEKSDSIDDLEQRAADKLAR